VPLPTEDQAEFARKCRHVNNILVRFGVPTMADGAAAHWVEAFADEADPTFSVLDWLEAGWRDPRLVRAALVVCGDRQNAEACMAFLRKDVGCVHRARHDRMLARAMAQLELRIAPAAEAGSSA
jgi:hypothetical protein